MTDTTYLAWTDPRKDVTPERLIRDACRRYEAKHGVVPTVALVHPGEGVALDGIDVRESAMVAAKTVYVGEDEN